MLKQMVLLLVLLPMVIFGQIGPDVSIDKDGDALKWEEGSRDYFVMFKSLLLNNNRTECTPSTLVTCNLGDDQPGNPQADACMDEATGSTFTLQASHIPQDAHVVRAFLVWTGATPEGQFDLPADNTVKLKFASNDSLVSLERDIAPTAHNLTDPKSFEFEGLDLANIAETTMGPYKACTDNAVCTSDEQLGEGWECIYSDEFGGKYCGQRNGIFTYRVDITDFFEEIHTKSNEAGNRLDGLGILGDYNVSGLTCVASPSYVVTSGLVGGWTILFVYTSEEINPKKIYIYNGMIDYQKKEQDINVKGFVLPDEAELRLSLHVLEGDPGLRDILEPTPAETLQLSGSTVSDWLPLFNDCNPPLDGYTEMYNSISSIYGWHDTNPTCVGDYTNKDSLEYAMDVDTIILNAKDAPFNTHLLKGDDNFWLKISANQDQIYTNYMILSVETKAPKFDIPQEREKDICTCSTDNDSVCFDRPFLYTINIQNWGETKAFGVTLKDTLPAEVAYIAGTTEKRVTKDGETGVWEKIEDGAGGAFPFTEAQPIADELYYCDKSAGTCQDSILVRFKVQPIADLPKHAVITNSAFISDNAGVAYHSNTSVPLRVREGSCPSLTECPEPPLSECGGSVVECAKDGDCDDNETCEDGQCVMDESSLSNSVAFSWEAGRMNGDESNTVYIPNPTEAIVLGQLSITGEGDNDKQYQLNFVSVKMNQGSSEVELKNLKMVVDTNANGLHDEGEPVISELATAEYAKLAIFNILDPAKRGFDTNKTYSLIFVADASFKGSRVTQTSEFFASIAGKDNFSIHDAGTPTLTGSSVTFSTFRFEPTEDAFIITKGDEVAPTKEEGITPLLQLRTKTVSGSDALSTLELQAMAGGAFFGSGVSSLKLFIDKNSDGKIDSADQLIQSIDEFAIGTRATFTAMDTLLNYPTSGDEIHLLVGAALNMNKGQTFQFKVTKATLKAGSGSGTNVVGLPIMSTKYTEGEDIGTTPDTGVTEEDGCSLTTLSNTTSHTNTMALFAMIAALLALSWVALRRD